MPTPCSTSAVRCWRPCSPVTRRCTLQRLPSPLAAQHVSSLKPVGFKSHDIPLRRTGLNPLADFATLLHLLGLMRRIRPTHVLGYTIKPVIYGSIAARLAALPYRFALITGLGYAFQGQEDGGSRRGLLRSLVQRLYRLALGGTHKVFFENPDDEALFRSLGILQPGTPSCVVVTGRGVDVVRFAVSPLPAAPRFLLIARLLGDKGVREYVQAARQVRTRHPEVHSVSSDGSTRTRMPSAKRNSMAGWPRAWWIFRGGSTTYARLSPLAAFSTFFRPDREGVTPRTVLEAMAMGRESSPPMRRVAAKRWRMAITDSWSRSRLWIAGCGYAAICRAAGVGRTHGRTITQDRGRERSTRIR